MYKIVKKEVLAPTIKLVEVSAPMIANKAQAGQFVIVRKDEKGERIPLTIADFNREKGLITLIFQEVGRSTVEMGMLEEGDSFLDVVGPLGEPTEIEKYSGKLLCVGGGVGIAPLYPVVKALKEAGNEIVSIIGARTKDLLFYEDEMREVSDELIVATDDGSYGNKGFVTDFMKEVLERENNINKAWVIGPAIMMKVACATTKPYNLSTVVSLNNIMVDGTGMCGACRVDVGEETKFTCVDGPEFDGHLVDWDLVIKRLTMYEKEEKIAMDALNKEVGV